MPKIDRVTSRPSTVPAERKKLLNADDCTTSPITEPTPPPPSCCGAGRRAAGSEAVPPAAEPAADGGARSVRLRRTGEGLDAQLLIDGEAAAEGPTDLSPSHADFVAQLEAVLSGASVVRHFPG